MEIVTGIWRRLRFALTLGLLACTGSAALAFQNTPEIKVDPESGVAIDLGLPFKTPPHAGFFPFHLKIHNGSVRAHEWTLRLRSYLNGSVLVPFQATAPAAAGETREFDLLVPLSGLNSSSYSYDQINGEVSGYGVKNGSFTIASGYSGGAPTSYVAMSDTLANVSWLKIDGRISGGSASGPGAISAVRLSARGTTNRVLYGSPVKLSELPADERALSGVAGLWLSQADWEGLTGALRAAILQWVEGGGHLCVACALLPQPALAELPRSLEFEKPLAIGFGTVVLAKLAGNELSEAGTVSQILNLDGSLVPPWEEDYSSGWSLLRDFPRPVLNASLVIAFVAVFAAVIGPCNFFWLAPANRRQRLFLTVPLLAAGGSGMLILCIALGDGFGAAGGRNVLALLSAGENRLTLLQEQVICSHLLLSRSFQLPGDVAISRISGLARSGEAPPSLERNGTSLGGDWFRSRTGEAQILRACVPSRAEVALQPPSGAPEEAPVLLSSASTAMHPVFYVDAHSHYWRGGALTPGRPLRLGKSSLEEYEKWMHGASADFSANLSHVLAHASSRPGYFYAAADPMPGVPIETLPSIRWEKQAVLCLGPCTRGLDTPVNDYEPR